MIQAGQRVLDFFIVGHAKSGTTALYEMLRTHPEIYMSDPKEPMFLASGMRPRFQHMLDPWAQNIEDYLALFSAARDDQLAGKASTIYLPSQTAAREIAQLNPAARIIALFRSRRCAMPSSLRATAPPFHRSNY